MNASGIRDTARVLHVSPTTVIKELKKKEPELQPVNHGVLASVHPEQVEVEIWRADELEVRRGLSSECFLPEPGVLCKRKRIRDGSGTLLITTPGRCWRMCSDDAKTPSSSVTSCLWADSSHL